MQELFSDINGIEKIRNRILQEARAEAEEYVIKAKEQAGEILRKAGLEADENRNEMLKQAQLEAKIEAKKPGTA